MWAITSAAAVALVHGHRGHAGSQQLGEGAARFPLPAPAAVPEQDQAGHALGARDPEQIAHVGGGDERGAVHDLHDAAEGGLQGSPDPGADPARADGARNRDRGSLSMPEGARPLTRQAAQPVQHAGGAGALETQEADHPVRGRERQRDRFDALAAEPAATEQRAHPPFPQEGPGGGEAGAHPGDGLRLGGDSRIAGPVRAGAEARGPVEPAVPTHPGDGGVVGEQGDGLGGGEGEVAAGAVDDVALAVAAAELELAGDTALEGGPEGRRLDRGPGRRGRAGRRARSRRRRGRRSGSCRWRRSCPAGAVAAPVSYIRLHIP